MSIGIDGMYPEIICGMGTKVDKGMWNGDFYTFFDKIFDTNKVQTTDFVEYNQLLDDEDLTTAKWCTEALHYLAIKIHKI